MQPVDTDTIRWTDGIVGHDPEAVPVERTERNGAAPLAYPDREPSLAALFDAAVERAPDREAVVYPEHDRRDTYADLDGRVDAVAAGLADWGVEADETVSVLLSNRPAFLETVLGCWRLGAVAAPLNTRLSARGLAYLLDHTDPACLVTEGAFLETLGEAGSDVDRLALVDEGDTESHAGDARAYADLRSDGPVPDADHAAEDTVAVFYTSGTTGHPKACPATNFQLTNAAVNYAVAFGTDPGLRALCTVPLFHVAGLVSNVLHALGLAGTTVVLDEFAPDRFLRTVAREAVEWVLGVPTNYVLAMERGDPSAYDLSAWEVGAYGGAPMPADTVARLREAFPGVDLCDAYGTTETVGGLATLCPDQYTDDHAETVGIPAPPVECCVLDGDGDRLGPGEVGELAIRGPIVIDGYLGRPEATAESFDDGWYLTGDLATVAEDGFVSLKGRDRDRIVRGGENVYALEVEEVLTAHEGVLEASVTGFPDAVLGERVLAAVVPTPDTQLTEDDLLAHCRGRLADYKLPEVVRILSELPKNPGGKVLKSELLPAPLEHGIRAGQE